MHEIACSNNMITYYWKMDINVAPTIIVLFGLPYLLSPVFYHTSEYCYHNVHKMEDVVNMLNMSCKSVCLN